LIKSSHTISLFAEGSDLRQRPTSFVASTFVHGFAIAIVWFTVAYTPRIARVETHHYTVRELNLIMPDEQQRTEKSKVAYPGPTSASKAPSPASNSMPQPPALREVAQTRLGPQTIIQADVPHPITLPDVIPLPQVMIWSPSKVQVKTIVPPLPQKPTTADVKPTVDRPNQELKVADVSISSTFTPSAKSIVTPSTTTPIAIREQPQVQAPPTTISQVAAQPTPAAILSLSDLRTKNGPATLPPVSESAASNSQGTLTTGKPQDKPAPGTGSAAAKSGQPGQGQDQSAKGSDSGPAQAAAGRADVPHPGGGTDSASDQEGEPGTTRIALPKDGRFGVVVVGNSLQEQFPEIAEVWNGRLAYTAYLHVGLSKSWILQYSVPRPDDAAAGGTIAHLEAPWPYNIVRPNLAPGSVDADALMIHGFVNQSGRFETLTVVFPQPFSQSQFILSALQRWQFRPATQDGQNARVEVLIIIPAEYE
jgi:hypothetical protein